MAILGLYNDLNTYLVIGAILFGMGIYGVVAQRTFIGMLIAAEMILAGASVNFMAFNRFITPDPVVGQVFTLFIMAVAAAEAAIGLSIVIAVYKNYNSIDAEDAVQLKG
ncbi:MAG: NADH-quinone oxidoreductase subunit NuoK [Desulfobulbaceae bacterium]|nr:NADH-quinone oxidoreductase subunit NuoK [Desulfobulbaceae bacterium]